MIRPLSIVASIALVGLIGNPALAQTGVDDDRVSLPEGPGSLEGVGENVEIDPNMGMMRYNIPIAAPKGFAGMGPDLALSYSSGSGSGPVGIGWSMSLPSIERMTSKGVPRYDTDDLFAFGGGEELVQVASEGGDLVYRDRFEKGFARYTWVGAGDGAEGFWKAEFRDGRVGYFGADQDGNLVPSARTSHPDGGTYRYHVVDIVDPYGHTLRYEYDRFGGNKPLAVAVQYVFVDDVPQYTVQIDYEERSDQISDAGAGFEEILSFRIAAVRALSGSEIVREYVLDYEDTAVSGGASRLRKVTTFGIGGRRVGKVYPIAFSFAYSQGLGVQCGEGDRECARPFLVDMGTAAPLSAGNATLLDINGDALPDILDSSQNGPHRFFINRLTPNGEGFDHGFDAPVDSAVVTDAGTLRLSAQNIQTLDINGDGFSDIFNTVTGNVLFNGGDGDWLPDGQLLATDAVPVFTGAEFVNMRFVDFDNDKRIDIIRSTPDQTQIFRNDGTAYDIVDEGVELIGVGFAGGDLQLSDMNGDGLNDPVEVQESGSIRFRLNLGRGKWGPFQGIPGVGVDPAEQDFVELEDLNNDGLSDVVIVVGTTIKYALNRNANNFDPFVTIDSDDIDGNIPAREGGVTVLFADMNGNGSEDVVWIDNGGRVQYLELFPVRPNLISRIDNGIGMVQKITYGTSVEHAARAEAAGEPWDVTLPNAMAVVDKIDLFVTLTGDEDGSGVHEVIDYTYRNGFYDGQEKQFRGFTDVVTVLQGDAFQEEGTTRFAFDNGIEDPYRNGLMLRQAFESDGRLLSEITIDYDDCPVDEIPDNLPRAVRHVCETGRTTVVQEGAEPEDWVTTRTEKTYDGYGNVTLDAELGVIARGGADCGDDCLGDESFTETDYVPPGDLWMLDKPMRQSTFTDDGSDFKTDERYFYDGDPFVGLAEGELTHGFLSRQTKRVSPDSDAVIEARRMRRDEHGNIIEVIDPNGDPGEPDAHRRTYSYDDSGLFLGAVEIFLTDPAGQPYQLRREIRYEPQFQNMIEATDQMLVQGGQIASPRNATRFRYDDFGRIVAIIRPGDTPETPTEQFAYEFGDPVTRVSLRSRTVSGGVSDEVTFRCFDGRGRKVQDRVQLAPGQYQVSGFEVFNNRGAVVESFQPFTSDSPDCDTAPPEGILSTKTKYDAAFRPREITSPDEGIYGEASITRTDYGPLTALIFDNEDADPDSPHADTPTVKISDGLGRLIAMERTINPDGGGIEVARYDFEYDNIGNFAAWTDPEGNTHTQTFDLLGRTVAVDDPNSGTTTFTYDDAGNITSTTDARGITTAAEYDGANRRVARFEQDNREATESIWRFDQDPDCPLQECTNLPGRLAAVAYPLEAGGVSFGEGRDRMGYDVRGLKVFEGRTLGDADMVVRTSYDNQRRPIVQIYPDGTEVETLYDRAGRPIAKPGFVDGVDYDARGQVAALRFANQTTWANTYDALLRLESRVSTDSAGQTIESFAYARDRNGNLTSIQDTGPGIEGVPSHLTELAFDDWYRPTAVTLSPDSADEEVLNITYSFIDQVLSLESSLGATSPAHVGAMTYDGAGPQAVTEAGTMALGYDDAGQMTQRGAVAMTWDHLGRMTEAAQDAGPAFAAFYGPDERRVMKIDDGSLTLYGPARFELRDGVGTTYISVDGDRVARRETTDLGAAFYPDVAPAGGDDTITAADAWATWAIGEGLIEGDNDGFDPELVLAASARRLLVENEDATAFLHTDHLGSITAATDEGGQVRGQRGYYPFGQQRWGTGYVDEYGFTGQERDRATGLLHFQFRYLDTFTGRWISTDPAFAIVTGQSMERLSEATGAYGYVANNPLNSIDPLGLKSLKKKGKKSGKKSKRKSKKKFKKGEKPDGPSGSSGISIGGSRGGDAGGSGGFTQGQKPSGQSGSSGFSIGQARSDASSGSSATTGFVKGKKPTGPRANPGITLGQSRADAKAKSAKKAKKKTRKKKAKRVAIIANAIFQGALAFGAVGISAFQGSTDGPDDLLSFSE